MRVFKAEIIVEEMEYMAGQIIISEADYTSDIKLLTYLCDAQYLSDTSLLFVERGENYFSVKEFEDETELINFYQIANY